jgi:hypothetical protein
MTEGNMILDPLKEVKIESDDAMNVVEFWQHFKLSMPEDLAKAAQNFMENSTVETQNEFRLAICKAVVDGKESIFEDEVFKKIKFNASKILFHSNFSSELEKVLDENTDQSVKT